MIILRGWHHSMYFNSLARRNLTILELIETSLYQNHKDDPRAGALLEAGSCSALGRPYSSLLVPKGGCKRLGEGLSQEHGVTGQGGDSLNMKEATLDIRRI